MQLFDNKQQADKIAVIGLGYVGLPLAVEFSKKIKVVGFDVKKERVEELRKGLDHTLEISSEDLKLVLYGNDKTQKGLIVTDELHEIADCKVYIVTVPTPIDQYKRPDLSPLIGASRTIGKVLKKGDVVIYESTVYPGCTEEDCVPVLEKESGLIFNRDFFCGYSPERINPGDKLHTVAKIKKVTSGSTPEVADFVDALYQMIITAGTFKASSLKVAEAAKVIENTQRDINIAFVNELAVIFNKLGIDTAEVLAAAGSKWNFLPFKPGLVGGHCIGVDPYYLTHKAQSIGHNPEIILAGRRINDEMGIYVANQVIKLMIRKGHKISGSSVLVLGVTFKENCPDIRNSRVIDIINELKEFECNVDIYDPWANSEEVRDEYGLELLDDKMFLDKSVNSYDAVVLAVAHSKFVDLNVRKVFGDAVIYDIKGFLDKDISDGRL